MKLIKIFILLLIVTLLVTQTEVLSNFLRPKSAYAVGDLSVDFGSGYDANVPVFQLTGMAPGDTATENIIVKNNSSASRPVAIKGVPTDDTDMLSTQMDITIQDGPTIIYGPKTVKEFFEDSMDPEGIELSTLNPGSTTTYTVTVKFKDSAGNDFQSTSLTFNIVVGISVAIPEACQNINLSGRFPIYGTTGNDRLSGTSRDDVIFGLEGNDRIDSGAGNDCIVGGAGDDRIETGAGRDIVLGEDGDDRIETGAGDDSIIGGSGTDTIIAGSGNDVIEGNDGNDSIRAESGNDEVSGGNGDDIIKGDAGNDTIHGDAGNDDIDGGAGNDMLLGDSDTDSIHGQAGRDTCNGETLKNCEVIL